MAEVHDMSFQQCVLFHGHQCPGLALGFRAAQAAMESLGVHRSEDEELVAVVENDSCAVDAVQVLTGCTFGKGNLFFKDHGKQALTLGSRTTGRAVRVMLKCDALQEEPPRRELLEKVQAGRASPSEREQYERMRRQRMREILDMDTRALFSIESQAFEFPQRASIRDSAVCARCGELTMVTRLYDSPRGRLCKACIKMGDKLAGRDRERDVFTIRSIGRIRSPYHSLDQCPHQGRQAGTEGEVVLEEDMLPAVKDLERFTHIILLSYYHLAERERLQTRTPHGPEIRGVFATRSPHRPNPIALNVVELLGIEGNRLRVRGVDCVDGTPVVDIKPYHKGLDAGGSGIL